MELSAATTPRSTRRFLMAIARREATTTCGVPENASRFGFMAFGQFLPLLVAWLETFLAWANSLREFALGFVALYGVVLGLEKKNAQSHLSFKL